MARKIMYFFVAAALLASGCTLFTNTSGLPSSGEIAQFQRVFMSSYYAESGRIPAQSDSGRALTPFLRQVASGSRATVPISKLTSVAFATLAPLVFSDYPEPAQTTNFTATQVATTTAFKVYDIKATTSYPAGDLRKSYVEEYYVADVTANPGFSAGASDLSTGWTTAAFNGQWTYDDPIVTPDTTSSTGWRWNQAARVQQVLTFTDNTTRTETIVSTSTAGGVKFDPTAFDINGSLDMSSAFVPAVSTDPNVLYSSVITYHVIPTTNPNFWFWQGTAPQAIVGVRYYTEVADTVAGTYTAFTASFEKTVSTLTTLGGTMAGTVSGIYVGAAYDALAESVLRQKAVYGLFGTSPTGVGAITTNMKTRVVNISGLKDFYLTQLNSDAVALSQASTTIYQPTPDAEAIVAADSTALAFTRTQQVVPATGALPFAMTTSDLSGAGALATIYTSITEGTYTTSVATAPTSNLLPGSGTVASFTGQQTMGTVLNPAATTVTNTMGSTGSVEVWLYMNTITNTAGIVHKGVLVDFSDECFSLQGWSNTGQIGIILDKAGTGNTYDSVLSTINLKKKTWYHVVATWDATKGASSYINLYINGALNKSAKPSVALYRENSSAVLVGSQLPTSYSSTYGYFGFDGKITGVNVLQAPMDATTVLNNYSDSKNNTANW